MYILCIEEKKLLKNIQQYNEFKKGITQKWILYLWILRMVKQLIIKDYYQVLKGSDKYVVLSNFSIYYTWTSIKNWCKNNKFKISTPTWNEEFELSDGSYSVSNSQDYFEYILKIC